MAELMERLIIVSSSLPTDEESIDKLKKTLMDVAHVSTKKGVVFYNPEEKKSPADIIRETFIYDKTQKFNYRIGNSLCIVTSEADKDYQHTLKLMTKTGIRVSLGFEPTDLTKLSSSALAEWLDTGKVPQKIESVSDDLSLEDLLEGKKITEAALDGSRLHEQSSGTGISPDDPFESAVGDATVGPSFDELMKQVNEEMAKKDIPTGDDVDEEYDGEPQYPLMPEPAVFEPSKQVKKPASIPDAPAVDVNDSEFAYTTTTTPKQIRSESTPAHEHMDDMDFVKQAKRARQQAEIDKLNAEKENEGREDALMTSRKGDADSSYNAHVMQRISSDTVEETHYRDGRRKNYRDFLPPEQRREQILEEKIEKDFGDTSFVMTTPKGDGGDLSYIPQGQGRVILCTAGKGGVGKSIVANGMAAALSLARAKEKQSNPGSRSSRVWLIESDYNSPQLSAAYKIRGKHLGNVAEVIEQGGTSVNTDAVAQAIEENVHIDKDTGVHILACPPLALRRSSAQRIPLAILSAVKYAASQGDDVIIDHGNLTTGEYSELDQILSLSIAHRVVVVMNMGCVKETQAALSVLCEESSKARPVASVSVVLNSSMEKQFYIAQDKLKPFEIVTRIRPIDELKAENLTEGSSYLPDVSRDVQKEIINRCGLILTHIGYGDLKRFFAIPRSKGQPFENSGGGKQRRGLFARISDMFGS